MGTNDINKNNNGLFDQNPRQRSPPRPHFIWENEMRILIRFIILIF